jgi:hypothetical protein
MGIVAIHFLQSLVLIQQFGGEHPAECASAKGSGKTPVYSPSNE